MGRNLEADVMAETAHTPTPSRIERRVLRACEAAGELVAYWGYKSIHGRIWALLALRRGPLSQTEIAERLGVSRSLVSTAITELAGFGVVRATGEHRNAPYEAVIDVWPAITDTLRSREWMLLETTRLTLESALEEAQLEEEGEYSAARIQLLLSMVQSIQRLLNLVISIRRPNSVAVVKEWVKSVIGLIETMRRFR